MQAGDTCPSSALAPVGRIPQLVVRNPRLSDLPVTSSSICLFILRGQHTPLSGADLLGRDPCCVNLVC